MKLKLAAIVSAASIMGTMLMGSPAQASSWKWGIDIASYAHKNGAGINWKTVKSQGYSFVFIKDTEGTYYVNPYYNSSSHHDYKDATNAGIAASAYAFANPYQSGGYQEANFFINNGGGVGTPVLDIEWNPYSTWNGHKVNTCYNQTPKELSDWVWWFEYQVHARTGKYPAINTPADWWNDCLKGYTSNFSNRVLWLEDSKSGKAPMPSGWSSWHWWQEYPNAWWVKGISGSVDVDAEQ